jgi:hypothetical protein
VLGYFENFPSSIHMVETFSPILSSKLLQRKLIQVFCEANQKEFTFEEVANPTFSDGTVGFEFGLADGAGFNFINQDEAEKAVSQLAKERSQLLDFFCAIRYHRGSQEKQTALKFDYYLVRAVFGKDFFEIRIHHERGPRYVSPQDLVAFIFENVNGQASRKALKKIEPP